MNNPSNLRLVFVTASPVLTNEVKKFYNDMKMHLIDQIIKHRERKRREKEKEGGKRIEEGKEEKKGGEEQEEEKEKEEEEEKEKEMMKEYIEIEEDVFVEEQELEKQLKLPYSLDHLTNSHFPLFATIKRFIYMLDASLEFSFFSRNYEGQIMGMESNVEWHNESKGVFMIN